MKLATRGPCRMAQPSLAGSIGFWPPCADEGLAGQNDAGEAVEQPEFAERVANVDLDAALRPFAARAQGAIEAEPPEFVGDRRAAIGMARRDQRQHVGKDLGDAAMRLGGDALFAGVGRGGDPDLPPRDAAGEFGEFLLVGGRRRGVVLEIADDVDFRRAEPGEPLSVGLALRQAEIDSPEQRGDEVGRASPAFVGARAHPRVDHRQRRAGAARFEDHVRPDLGFGDQREIRPPMGEEAAHESRRVERRELVQRAGRQALRQQPRRGDRAGGDERMATARRRAARPAASATGPRRRWRRAARPAAPPGGRGWRFRAARRPASDLPWPC